MEQSSFDLNVKNCQEKKIEFGPSWFHFLLLNYSFDLIFYVCGITWVSIIFFIVTAYFRLTKKTLTKNGIEIKNILFRNKIKILYDEIELINIFVPKTGIRNTDTIKFLLKSKTSKYKLKRLFYYEYPCDGKKQKDIYIFLRDNTNVSLKLIVSKDFFISANGFNGADKNRIDLKLV